MKQEALEKNRPGVRRVLAGNIFVSEALAARWCKSQVRSDRHPRFPREESERPRAEVFQMIGAWKRTTEIAPNSI